MTNGDVMQHHMFDDDVSKGFFCDVLSHMANLSLTATGVSGNDGAASAVYCTARDAYSGAREDATAGEPSASDEAALLVEARPSPMDLGKAREATDAIIKFLQVTACRINHF